MKLNLALISVLIVAALLLSGCGDLGLTRYTSPNSTSSNTSYSITNVSNQTTPAPRPIFSERNVSTIFALPRANTFFAIISSSNRSVVFDTGSKGDSVLGEVRKAGVPIAVVLTTNQVSKTGNAEVLLLLYNSTLYETGIKDPDSSYYPVEKYPRTKLDKSSVISVDDFTSVVLKVPYEQGFLGDYKQNTIIPVITARGKVITDLTTCGVECQDKIMESSILTDKSDILVLPNFGDCNSTSIAFILVNAKQFVVPTPKCEEYKTILNEAGLTLLDYPIRFGITSEGEILWMNQ